MVDKSIGYIFLTYVTILYKVPHELLYSICCIYLYVHNLCVNFKQIIKILIQKEKIYLKYALFLRETLYLAHCYSRSYGYSVYVIGIISDKLFYCRDLSNCFELFL